MAESTLRSLVPGALLVLGLGGLGMAAASELELSWDGTFQAGALDVQADCQDGPIDVAFTERAFASGVKVPWTIDSVEFTGISEKCHRMDYEAAYKLSQDGEWSLLDSRSLEVGRSIFAWLRDADSQETVDPQEVFEIALTIQAATD